MRQRSIILIRSKVILDDIHQSLRNPFIASMLMNGNTMLTYNNVNRPQPPLTFRELRVSNRLRSYDWIEHQNPMEWIKRYEIKKNRKRRKWTEDERKSEKWTLMTTQHFWWLQDAVGSQKMNFCKLKLFNQVSKQQQQQTIQIANDGKILLASVWTKTQSSIPNICRWKQINLRNNQLLLLRFTHTHAYTHALAKILLFICCLCFCGFICFFNRSKIFFSCNFDDVLQAVMHVSRL